VSLDPAGEPAAQVATSFGATAELLAIIERHDRAAALSFFDSQVASLGTERLITEVLAPVQVEAGDRWESGRWSISQEHAASAFVQAALEMISERHPARQDEGRVVLTCVEDESHSIPARMFGELLRQRGWSVDFLGAWIDPATLADLLWDIQPVAVAVSCSVPMNVIGAAQVIDASHAAGFPVLAGGRGLTRQRARKLGADQHVGDLAAAVATLQLWRGSAVPVIVAPRPGSKESGDLLLDQKAIVDDTMSALYRRLPSMATFSDRQLSRTRADYVYILRFLAAAVLIDDLELFTDFLLWLREILLRTGLPATVLPLSLEVLRTQLGHYPAATRLLDAGLPVASRPLAGSAPSAAGVIPERPLMQAAAARQVAALITGPPPTAP
jgi:methanogenic corrinoid protein MtbC1